MKRLDNLQGFRAIAFMMIFLSHCGIGNLAGMSVSIFFVLSGFLMIYNYFDRQNVGYGILYNIKFSYKKISKLFPVHIIMLFPMLLLQIYSAIRDGIITTAFVFTESIKLLSNVLLIQSWIPVRQFYFGYNGVAWFLSVCTFLYFIFPYLLKLLKQKWSIKKSIISIFLSLLIQTLCAFLVESDIINGISEHLNYITYICPLYRVWDFIMGCNLGYIFLHAHQKADFSCKKATLFEILGIVLMFTFPYLSNVFDLNSISLTVRFIPGALLFIYILAFNKGFISKILSNKYVVKIGNISAYTFLIHQVVINYVQIIFNNKFIVAFISLVSTFVLTYIFSCFTNKNKSRL